YVAGSGHSHLLAEEVFYRAGGIAAAQAILDPDLMLHLGAERSTLLEREEGRAERALADYPVGPGDVVFIASNSGRNAYPIEMALAAKARGALTIAITSMRHATAITSRHGSGKLLYQVTDLVLDNGGEYGDAALVVGHDRRMGPTSTIAGVFILNAVLAEAVDKLAGIGVDVDVYQSANMQGAEAAAQEMIRRWQARIRGL
ncbi:sugar isomerase domain-containing protein, partial [Devosia sp.]|uniref:sugar isomerase domain-containing protein n=1 Tax=Devosia sp. TaxID=1871048 RepID=UPI001AD1E7DC